MKAERLNYLASCLIESHMKHGPRNTLQRSPKSPFEEISDLVHSEGSRDVSVETFDKIKRILEKS